jgi:beta-lactamase regulating signal transducer with metallopeptidase domain
MAIVTLESVVSGLAGLAAAAPAVALRVTVLLGLALASMPLLGRAASGARRLVLALALGGALVLPLVSAVVPAWSVEAPAAARALRGRILPEAVIEGPAPAVVPAGARDGATSAAASHRPARSLRVDGLRIAGVAWALGALLVAARLATGLLRSRAIVRRSTPATSWSIAVARAETAVGLRAVVRFTRELDAPAVTGVRTPVVLVPDGSASWSDDRRYAVLLHELAHVRQRDCLAQIVGQLACAVHWWNPLAWLAARQLRVERELAADDAVIRAGTRASSYAEDLLAIAGAHAARPAPAGALGMAERSQLAVRVRAIVSLGRTRKPLGGARASLLAAGAALVVLVVACATPSAKPGGAAPASPIATAVSPAAASLPAAKLASPAATSTLDPAVQAIAEEELTRILAESKGAAGAILVLEPASGEILASAGRAKGKVADVATQSAYVTGSTLKALTLTAALEAGAVTETDRFDCQHGQWTYDHKVLQDAGSNGVLSVPEMLAVSTNIGFAKIFDRLGGEKLGRWLRLFHLGVAPPVPGATAGWIPERIEDHSYAGAVTAIGESVTASPLQLAAAYAAIANGGAYVAPTLERRRGDAPREVIMKPETARTMTTMLEAAVYGEHATGKLAQIAGVKVAGKTGTAGWDRPDGSEGTYASFVGFAPSRAPRFVMVVGVEQPSQAYTGASIAAPAFARVGARVLGR